MSDELQEFYVSLMQEVGARATARGELTRTVLVDELARRLVEAEELQDWTPCYFDGKGHRRRAISIDGYSDDELGLDGSIRLLIADVRSGDQVENLTTTDVSAAFSRATGFALEARHGRLMDGIEPSTPAADLATLIQESAGAVRTLRVLLLSNAALSSRYQEVERTNVESMKAELHVWDLKRFQQIQSQGGREDLDLDLTAFTPQGIPALPASIGESEYAAYLCVVPGKLLADVYERHGSRLLEGNVRAFLNTQGKVNKGIRKTIQNQPSRFFAFNNGITATAKSVKTETGGGSIRITGVTDLQIVNGGQTTASLYNAMVKDGVNLDGIFVQMKVSVLSPEIAETMIPEISQYANTQNKVSDADLFANHPFHLRIQEISRRVWAPPKAGSQQLTHWFYERARAQYQTETLKLKGAAKKEFSLRNPKDQVITKTDLAKVENSWLKLPHIVSLHAQKNFVKYAEAIREHYDLRPDDFNDRWFQHVVARTVIFDSTERIVSNADWYIGGYRANIVTYAIARVSKLIGDTYHGKVLDFDRIWKAQQISEALERQLNIAAEAAQTIITKPPPPWTNAGEWAKKEQCWERVAGAKLKVESNLADDLKPADEERGDRKDARIQAREDGVISAQVEAVRKGQQGVWGRALTWPTCRKLLSPVEYGILLTAAKQRPGWIPTDAQASRLMAALARLQQDGFE